MIEDYIGARKLGLKKKRKDVAEGKYPYLPALDDIVSSDRVMKVGTVEIPIERIVGTKTHGRQNSFAANFMPLIDPKSEFAGKWSRLYDSQVQEGIREPIIVYEYMQRFYVQEGNKRVSVSRYVGAAGVTGTVTRVMPEPSDDVSYKVYMEFVRFYDVCPLYGLEFSQTGGYKRIADAFGEDLEHPWPREKVQNLRYLCNTFESVFEEKRGGKLDITAGDALLIYIEIYGTESLEEDSKAVIGANLTKIWGEISLAGKGDQGVDLVESPEDAPAETAKDAISLAKKILMPPTVYSREKPLRVAFLYDATPQDSSLCYAHELGREDLVSRFDGAVDALHFDGCRTEEEIQKAIETASVDKDNIIFTVSPAQMPATLKNAISHPEIQFFNCSINLVHNAVQTYYARTYEPKFLMGALAASLAENHRIGYRATVPVYGAVADINAFAIGAEMIDSRVKVYLSWDSMAEDEWHRFLKENDIRIVSGPEMIIPTEASREYGLYRIDGQGGIVNLAAPMINWGKYYELLLRPVVEGRVPAKVPIEKDVAVNYWMGMSAGVIDVILSRKVPYSQRKLVSMLRTGMIKGGTNPFDGELHSQEGIVREEGSSRLTNKDIITMSWLNDNVEGSLPRIKDLPPARQEVVEVSGVDENERKKG